MQSQQVLDLLAIPAQKAGIEQYAASLLTAIGSGLSTEDQEFLSQNLMTLPAYFKTKEGGQVMSSAVNYYRAYVKREQGL